MSSKGWQNEYEGENVEMRAMDGEVAGVTNVEKSGK